MSDPVEHDSKQQQWRLLFWAAVVIAVGIRARRLGESLWYDEVFAWIDYASQGPGHILSTMANPVNHVLNTLLTWASVNALGDIVGIEISMRLPAFIASIALIPVMFGFVRELMPEQSLAPYIAAWLAAVLAIPGLEGVESRGYSMMILASATSTWMLVRFLNQRSEDNTTNWKTLSIYTVATALGIYAHMVTVVVPVGHAIVVAAMALRTRQWHGLLPIATAAAITIVLFIPLFDDILGTRSMYVTSDQGQPTLFGIEGAHALLGLGGAWSHPATAPGLVLLLYSSVMLLSPSIRATLSPMTKRAIIVGSIGAPVIVAAVLIANTWIYARFTLFLMPVAILLMTAGTIVMLRRFRRAGFVILALITTANVVATFRLPPKQPMRDVMQHVDKIHSAGARVLVVGLAHPVMNVYSGQHTIEYSYLHGQDFDAIADAFNPDCIIVMYPNNVGDDVRFSLSQRMELWKSFEGWGDWGNCSLELYGPPTEWDPSTDPNSEDEMYETR